MKLNWQLAFRGCRRGASSSVHRLLRVKPIDIEGGKMMVEAADAEVKVNMIRAML